MQKFIIPLLTVVMVVSITFAGCAPATPPEQPPEAPPEEPELPPEEPELPPTALPRSGEWTASTGATEFTFTFTVNPDGTGIAGIYFCLTKLECDGVRLSVEMPLEFTQIIPITDGQFAIEDVPVAKPQGELWSITVRGRFDETGTQASGTWEISAYGTTCLEGNWSASAP